MKQEKVFLFLSFLLIIMLIPSVISTSIAPPQETIFCEVNVSSLEEELCEGKRCEVDGEVVCKVNNCTLDELDFLFKRKESINVDIEEDELQIESITVGQSEYNLTAEQKEILDSACQQEIRSVLDYIDQNISEEDCEFYPPETNITGDHDRLEGGWKVKCQEFEARGGVNSNPDLRLFVPFFLFPFIIIFSILFGAFIFLIPSSTYSLLFVLILFIWVPAGLAYLLFKKLGINLNYLWPLVLGFLGGLYGYYRVDERESSKRILILGFVGLGVSLFLWWLYIVFTQSIVY